MCVGQEENDDLFGINIQGVEQKITHLQIVSMRKKKNTRRDVQYWCLLQDRSKVQVYAADVQSNFTKEFISTCRKAAKFVPLQIGSSESRGLLTGSETFPSLSSISQDESCESPTSNGGTISLHSSLKYRDIRGRGFCVPLSLASALHELEASNSKGEDLGALLSAAACQVAGAKKQLKAAKSFLRGAGWTCNPLTKDSVIFDPLTDISEFPTLALLKGTRHAITILGEQIFDANKEHALPLNLLSLKRCVGKGREYQGIGNADRFMPGAKARKGIRVSESVRSQEPSRKRAKV